MRDIKMHDIKMRDMKMQVKTNYANTRKYLLDRRHCTYFTLQNCL